MTSGAAACVAAAPAAVTVVGVPVTVATCSGCAALAGAGILTTAAGVAMGRPVPEPVNPKKRDEKWLERHGVDPHDMPLC